MKYKLIKYDENYIKGYIDIDGIFNIYKIMNKKLIKKFDYHLKFIQDNPEYYNKYNCLVQKIDYVIQNNPKYKKKHSKYLVQHGGQFPVFIPFIMSGVSSSLIVGLVVAYVIFRLFTAPKCRPIYPISLTKPVPDYKQIISNLIPAPIIQQYFPQIINLNDQELITSTREFLDTFSVILSVIAPDSIVGQVASQVVELAAGVAVTALEGVTAGATTVINYLLKAFNLIKDAIGLLIKFVEAVINLTDILVDDNSKRLLNDIFMIDFTDGSFGVKCWIEYILDKYGNDNLFLKSACGLFNKILSMVYDKLISFISKAISFAVPEGGITGVLFSGIVSMMKCKTYDFALLRLNKAYDKMSYDKQILFEKPALMKKTLDGYLSKGKFFIDKFDDIVSKNLSNLINSGKLVNVGNFTVYNFLSSNTEFFSFALNKIFAMVFAVMYILTNCAKKGFCDTLLDEINPQKLLESVSTPDASKTTSKSTLPTLPTLPSIEKK